MKSEYSVYLLIIGLIEKFENSKKRNIMYLENNKNIFII